jgi:hypothetical protein
MRRKTFKPTRLKLSSIQDPEARQKIDDLVMEFEVAKQVATEKHRASVIAQGEAQIAMVKVNSSIQKILGQAADLFTEIAREPTWFIFRRESDVIFESVFTERAQRNLIRAQMSQLDKSIDSDGDGKDDDMFESGEGEDEGSH